MEKKKYNAPKFKEVIMEDFMTTGDGTASMNNPTCPTYTNACTTDTCETD